MKILSRSVPECSCMLLVHMLLRESCQQAVQNLGKVGDKGEEAKKEEGKMRVGEEVYSKKEDKVQKRESQKDGEVETFRTRHMYLALPLGLV